MSAPQLGALCALLPALAKDIAAGLIGQLLAAVPRLKPEKDSAGTDRALVKEVADWRPRDVEEAMLAVQFVAAQHTAMLCLHVAGQLDFASREASRLRRDATVQQRVMTTLQRALHRSQARPMLSDPATGETRPTVPPVEPRSAATRQRPSAPAEAEQPPKPFPPPDVFDGHPDLKALNDRWDTLPNWEDMTMEERRQTWGYKPEEDAAEDE